MITSNRNCGCEPTQIDGYVDHMLWLVWRCEGVAREFALCMMICRKRRTEHLESLPHGLLVQDMLAGVGVGAVLDALHVLVGMSAPLGAACERKWVHACHFDQSELLEPCRTAVVEIGECPRTLEGESNHGP